MNLGKLNEANDIATMIISPSNEEPSILTRLRREKMMQKLSLQENEEINRLPTEDVHCLKSKMCIQKMLKKKKRSINCLRKIYIIASLECCTIQKTSIIKWITCRNKMKYCAEKFTEESHPCSTTLVLSHSTIQISPTVIQ